MTLKDQLEIRRRNVNLFDLGGLSDYKQVWDYQKELVELRVKNTIPDSLILTEHSHVFTMGRNGKRENVLDANLPFFEVERGGDVTYHGPGQLVVYPILYLSDYSLGVKGYVELLEKILVETLDEFGIESEGRLGRDTGVWTESRKKIASIGVAISHWVSYHGVALNVSSDLSYFDKIRPCGFESAVMTSMEREKKSSVDMEEVKNRFLVNYSKEFDAELIRDSPQKNFNG